MGEIENMPTEFADYIQQYAFRDTQEFYTNGAELIPTFRVYWGWGYYLGQLGKIYRDAHGDMEEAGIKIKEKLKEWNIL